VGSGRRGHASEAYQRSPHARQVPQERHFSAPLGICRRQVGQGRVRRMRGPTVPMRRLSHILRCARTARSITGPWGLALRRDSALEHLGCRHNEARTIRRPRPGGRLPGPGRGPRRPPEQAGPARVPASESGSSCCPVYTHPGGASSTSGSRPQRRVAGLVSRSEQAVNSTTAHFPFRPRRSTGSGRHA